MYNKLFIFIHSLQVSSLLAWVIITCTFLTKGCIHHTPSKLTTIDDIDLPFNQYEIDSGTAKHQTVLTGYLLGNATAELAVINENRILNIYSFNNGTWESIFEETLQPDVLFTDIANIGGIDRLITYTPGRFHWFDPVSATEHPLIDISAPYKKSDNNEIPHVDITRDINHDGRDDLVMPDNDGFWLSTQLSNGSFTALVKLGPPEPFLNEIPLEYNQSYQDIGITSHTIPWYFNRIHEMDFNQDGFIDLVFWDGDQFTIHFQNKDGNFNPKVHTSTTEIAFDSDGIYSLRFGFNDNNLFSQIVGFSANTKRTVLHSFCDMNGDSVADLITQSYEGKGALKLRNWYEIHFGKTTSTGIEFAREASMVLQPQTIAKGNSPFGYSLGWMQDFDGDNQVDFIFGRVNTGIGGFFRAIAANSITMNIEYFHIKDGVFPPTPNGTLRIKPDLEFIRSQGPFFPTVLLGDVNGDGLTDLLTGANRDELHIYHGKTNAEVFSAIPQTIRVDLPANEQHSQVVDLNRDSKDDLLIHHRSHSEPNRIITLISK